MGKLLDHGAFEPLYHQLKKIIEEKVDLEEWKPGDKISSENDLQIKYEISRNTVQRALDELVQDGILERRQGKGTFVAKPKIEQSLTSFYSFSKVMESQGMNPRDVILKIETTTVKSKIAKILQIDQGEEVIALQRLRQVNDEPIILETSYLPKKIVPTLSSDDLEKYSLYDLLEEKHKIIVTKAKEIFEPVLVRDTESKYLNIPEGAPGLLLDRIAYDTKGRPVEFCRSLIRGDRCRFYTELL